MLKRATLLQPQHSKLELDLLLLQAGFAALLRHRRTKVIAFHLERKTSTDFSPFAAAQQLKFEILISKS